MPLIKIMPLRNKLRASGNRGIRREISKDTERSDDFRRYPILRMAQKILVSNHVFHARQT